MQLPVASPDPFRAGVRQRRGGAYECGSRPHASGPQPRTLCSRRRLKTRHQMKGERQEVGVHRDPTGSIRTLRKAGEKQAAERHPNSNPPVLLPCVPFAERLKAWNMCSTLQRTRPRLTDPHASRNTSGGSARGAQPHEWPATAVAATATAAAAVSNSLPIRLVDHQRCVDREEGARHGDGRCCCGRGKQAPPLPPPLAAFVLASTQACRAD